MMKLMFLKNTELAETLTEILHIEDSECSIEYSENKETDVFYIPSTKKEIAISDLLGDLGNFTNEKISRYDVCEVGDEGEGFVFFIA